MKRTIALLLLAALLLCGCAGQKEPENAVTFYYLRSSVTYGADDGVVAPELRGVPVPNADLPFLLSLYMKGPQTEGLTLPLPAGTRLTDTKMEGNTLTVTFSTELSYLDGLDLTAACACIGYTCLSITDAETIRIEAPAVDYGEAVSFTVTRDTFLLYDDTTEPVEATPAS